MRSFVEWCLLITVFGGILGAAFAPSIEQLAVQPADQPECDLIMQDGRDLSWPRRDDGRCYAVDAGKKQ